MEINSASAVVGDGDLFHLYSVVNLHLPVWQHACLLAQRDWTLRSVVSLAKFNWTL